MNDFLNVLKNEYAEFSGRVAKKKYWMYILFYVIFCVVAIAIDVVTGLGFVALIFSLALLVPTVAITTRRFHDISKSGWWQLIGLIPLLGLFAMIYFMIQESHEKNEYGEAGQVSSE